MTRALCLIEVREITNTLLDSRRWRVGSFARVVHTPYGFTFEPCFLGEARIYDSVEGAKAAIVDKGGKFVGVKFGVVRFREVK